MFRELTKRCDYVIEEDEIELMRKLFAKPAIKTTPKHVNIMFERRREILYEHMLIDDEREKGETVE